MKISDMAPFNFFHFSLNDRFWGGEFIQIVKSLSSHKEIGKTKLFN